MIAIDIGVFSVLDLWGEMLWFESLDQSERFWRVLGAQGAAMALGISLGALGAWLLTRSTGRFNYWLPRASALAGAVIGAIWGLANWEELLLFVNRVDADIHEPILGLDAGFYLFTLPFLDQLLALALWIALIAVAAALGSALRLERSGHPALREEVDVGPLLLAGAMLGVTFGLYQVVAVFHLLFSELGVVQGPGWTDAHVRLPAQLLMALFAIVLVLLPLLPTMRRRLDAAFTLAPQLGAVMLPWIGIGLLWLLAVSIVPAAFQWLLVVPNEITMERQYIENNIRFTRYGFGLNEIEEREFPARGQLTREELSENRVLLDNVRLWDWRALDAVYSQFQEIRLYYEFQDVDVDRYRFDGRYREVMVSAREMAQENLPADSQTFVNRRFKYTHGYGLTMAAVNEFTEDGLPHLLVKDIPPVSTAPELAVDRPQIYYGERSVQPVVVNSSEPEFDYPKGDENVYIHYPGQGGVELSSLWRKFVFGWKFDGTRFFLSSYPTRDSRVMFDREVRRRVHKLAPFLVLDDDPYVVLENGRLYWIVDAYTVSQTFPYSTEFKPDTPVVFDPGRRSRATLYGVNYARNSVKAVVDAFEGGVELYVFEPDDPVIRAWRNAFPGLFRDRARMPEALRAHVRYPVDYLLTQGQVYASYHMTDPNVFYNQEDLWVRATEKHYSSVVPVDPYYVMWEQPGSDQVEFSLILPFTPKNRQVLIGWIAGLCDGENYGRFVAYRFPKDQRVLGPQQVETKIDQDRFLAGQLTLWDQRGSNVIRGNVLAIPIADTLMYVEPIYLEAETAAYPELRLVVVMQDDRMSYGETFEQALEGLFGKGPAEAASGERSAGTHNLARRAQQAFNEYLKLLAEQNFDEAAARLATLSDLLGQMAGREREEAAPQQ